MQAADAAPGPLTSHQRFRETRRAPGGFTSPSHRGKVFEIADRLRGASVARINSLKIRKLGNVVPGTELKFGAKGAVLLGRNGTGKTTLLNILAGIGRCDLKSLSEEDYDLEFSMSCPGNVELTINAKYEKAEAAPLLNPPSGSIADAMRTALQERSGHLSLRIEALHLESGERTLVESNDSETRYKYPDGKLFTEATSANQGWLVFWRAAIVDAKESPLFPAFADLMLLSTRLRRFDESLDYFADLTLGGPNSAYIEWSKVNDSNDANFVANFIRTRLISPSCTIQLIEDYYNNGGRYPFGVGHSSEIGYLGTFCELAGFEQASLWADLDEKRQSQGGEIISLSPLRFSMKRNGAQIHHRHLSFGQRRLLAFLHYHDSSPQLIIADELVNGMHHEWIMKCLHIMSDAQAFLSSQNPLLFDFLPLESVADVAERFVCCDLDEQHRFLWRNMSDADALELYETHKVGLQHTSEILRTRGYW